jgi:hypothetical protein
VVGDDRALENFVGQLHLAAERARDTTPAAETWLSLAEHPVHLRIAGAALHARSIPALAHLVGHVGRASLTIDCWDRNATGVEPPPPPVPQHSPLMRGGARELVGRDVRMTYDSWMRMLCVYDRRRDRAFVTVADADQIPAWVDRAPLRTIFTWWAGDTGLAFLHASAVTSGDGAIVLAGASGSGKSTTAMACFADGLGFIADDACLVRLDPQPTVFTVYGKAKLERDAFHNLPQLAELAVDPDGASVVIDATRRVVPSAPLRAVVLPTLTDGRRSRLAQVSPTAARRLLVRTTLVEGGAGGAALGPITELAGRVPCYRLELGSDLTDVVSTVRTVLGAA